MNLKVGLILNNFLKIMKNNNDLVSICIPSYNHSLFLKNCLDSILQESYPNIEIDILDDG